MVDNRLNRGAGAEAEFEVLKTQVQGIIRSKGRSKETKLRERQARLAVQEAQRSANFAWCTSFT